MRKYGICGVAAVLMLGMAACASRGVEQARELLSTSASTAWSLRAASSEPVIDMSPAQKTLRLAGSAGTVLGTGVSAVVNDKLRRQLRDALQGYDAGLVFEERLVSRLTDALGPNRVAPMGSTAGFQSRQAAQEARCLQLADAGHTALLDVKMTFGLFGPAGTLVAELDGSLYTLPEGHLRWSSTITVTPEPVLAESRLGNPKGGLLPVLGQNLVSVEDNALSQWTEDGGVRYRLAHEAAVDAAVSALLCELGYAEEAMGEYQLGIQALHKEAFDEASAHFRRALQLDAALVDARNAVSVTEAHAGHLDNAIALAREITETDPHYGPAQHNLAWWYAMEKGDIAAARPYYETSLSLGMPISEKLEKTLGGK
ncbi:MAG: hypothetical protein KA184_17395 [Candidatus Hydrogenedentes bacterium]|nr:hypothetical protein [Candidatus Hydrogenedentota bacterium]